MTATSVETFARKLRFQALGRACKDLGSPLLLLAHHYDDQAETLLMRLVKGHTATLTGIRKIANIPECDGLHGISQSGSCLKLESSMLPRSCGVTGLERGGIQVGRPLLDFNKSRLLATCQELEMPWFEDETNTDRTLTSRNAIRHIAKKYRLPEALRSRSLVELSERKRQTADGKRELSSKFFDEMPLTLDLRSGVVTVEFPKLDLGMISEESPLGMSNISDPTLIVNMLVKRVVSIVPSSTSTAGAGRFNALVKRIYNIPDSGFPPSIQESISVAKKMPRIHETSGLCFEHLKSPRDEDFSMRWRIYRAPARKRETEFANNIPPASSNVFKRIGPIFRENNTYFWDNRYWIRVHNPAEHDLWVRPLDEKSLSSLRTLLVEGKVFLRRQSDGEAIKSPKYLDILLRETGRGKIRWTLPVIVSYTPIKTAATADVPSTSAHAQILAFPTLGLRVEAVEDGFWPPWAKDLRWEIRFKRIDLGNKKLEDCLVSGGLDEMERKKH